MKHSHKYRIINRFYFAGTYWFIESRKHWWEKWELVCDSGNHPVRFWTKSDAQQWLNKTYE